MLCWKSVFYLTVAGKGPTSVNMPEGYSIWMP